MKKFLPALSILILVYAGCKKEKNTNPAPTSPVPVSTGTGATGGNPSLSLNIAPMVVAAGMTISLPGTNLPAASEIKVSFNGVEAQVISCTTSIVVVKIPATTSGNITAIIGTQTLPGPAFTVVNAPIITATDPLEVTSGTVVTITGTGFKNDGLTTKVLFGGVAATVQSITATEIKVVTPVTTSGKISVVITPAIYALSQAYTYTAPELLKPYASGTVTLRSQTDVDVFVSMNKGKNLQITGDLNLDGTDINSVSGLSLISAVSGNVNFTNVSGITDAPFINNLSQAGGLYFKYSGLTSLSFNGLKNFTGILYLTSMDKLTRITFNGLTKPSSVYVKYSPLLTDLSFLSNITATGAINITNVAAPVLVVDQVRTINDLRISNCPNMTSVSMRSLQTNSGTDYSGFELSNCQALTSVAFATLTSIAGLLSISGTGLSDLNGFSSLTSVGSLSLYSNPALNSLLGLKNLTAVTIPAVTNGPNVGGVSFNGIFIDSNPKLTSMNGLQGVTNIPMLRISRNSSLNDYCPLKKQIIALSALPAYTYKYLPCCETMSYKTGSIAALSVESNGGFSTTKSVVDGLALCL